MGCLWDPYVQVLPSPGLRELLHLVQLRDAFVETQIRRHEWQEHLQAELWQELGPGDTPEVGDAARLPLLHATVTETLRLQPPAPLALPPCARRPTRAGSILLPNIPAAHMDPNIWQHPEAFLPERFLAPGAPLRSLLPFGCGARSCLGEGVAQAELLVFLGGVLREFCLEPPTPGALASLCVGGGTVLRCPAFRVHMVPCGPPALAPLNPLTPRTP
ncbi:steroid 21-hydroxylase-like [Pterocles gutturalis]